MVARQYKVFDAVFACAAITTPATITLVFGHFYIYS
jgi:hypothetical protein